MCTRGISRNIPAAHRSLIIDRAAEADKWPGAREIRAVVTQGKLRVTYDGQGGYACLRIDPDEDIDRRLVAIDRLIEHDRDVERIRASLLQMRMECDWDPDTLEWLDDDADIDMPIWTWSVPESMAIAYREENPPGLRQWLDTQFENMRTHLSYNPGSEVFAGNLVSMRAEGWGQHDGRRGKVELFSVKNDRSMVSWNTKDFRLKINMQLPDAVVTSLEGRSIGSCIEHPLIHPETVVRRAKKEKGSIIIEMWRQGAVIQPAPVQSLEEVMAIEEQYERTRT